MSSFKNPTYEINHKKGNGVTSLPTLLDYCHKKNIPFCENEKRFYDVMKSKQNHKYWVENWKKYCNLNIVDPPVKPAEIP